MATSTSSSSSMRVTSGAHLPMSVSTCAAWICPINPANRRLAVATEDHVLEHADYDGIAPEGSQNPKAVLISDHEAYLPLD